MAIKKCLFSFASEVPFMGMAIIVNIVTKQQMNRKKKNEIILLFSSCIKDEFVYKNFTLSKCV